MLHSIIMINIVSGMINHDLCLSYRRRIKCAGILGSFVWLKKQNIRA